MGIADIPLENAHDENGKEKLCVGCSDPMYSRTYVESFCHNPDCVRFGLISIAYQTR